MSFQPLMSISHSLPMQNNALMLTIIWVTYRVATSCSQKNGMMQGPKAKRTRPKAEAQVGFFGRGQPAPSPLARWPVGAYSTPPDPLAGGEGAGCPLPKNPTRDSAFGLVLWPFGPCIVPFFCEHEVATL